MTRSTHDQPRRTAYTVDGITRKGLRCESCNTTWYKCEKSLWQDRKGVCCAECEAEDTHDVPSLAEMKQLAEVRELNLTEETTEVEKLRKELKEARAALLREDHLIEMIVGSRVAAMTQGLHPQPIIFGKAIIKPALLRTRRSHPQATRLRRAHNDPKIYSPTYYKIGTD